MRPVLHALIRRFVPSIDHERTPDRKVRFDIFVNLVHAYEQRLRERGSTIQDNATRPSLLSKLLGTPPSEAYFLIEALAATGAVPGDVCEFGVAQGLTSALIANEIVSGNKCLHLFDSFQGLPKPTAMDQLRDDVFSLGNMDAYEGAMSSPECLVRAQLHALRFPPERYVVHRGFLDQVLKTRSCSLPSKVSFAYVDLDLYEPIKSALRFVDPLTTVGSVVIVDDYNFFSTGVKAAVDECVREWNTSDTRYRLDVPSERYGHFAVLTRC